MPDQTHSAAVPEESEHLLALVKVDRHRASDLMQALARDEQVALVSYQAVRDPRKAQELIFLLDDENGRNVVSELDDKTVFRIMKSQSSTHIGVLSLLHADRVQSILDLDQELFSTKGYTDSQTAYHWLVSFLEEDDLVFADILKRIDIKVVASAFQDRIARSTPHPKEEAEEGEEPEAAFPADFFTKLDRGELKPDDLEVTDEETRDILTKIHLVDESYFTDLVSLMIREEDLRTRAAEEAFDRIHAAVGDLKEITEEAEDMFVPLDE
jgi:hypothetical protein